MRIFALELNNDIKGINERKAYIESLVSGYKSISCNCLISESSNSL